MHTYNYAVRSDPLIILVHSNHFLLIYSMIDYAIKKLIMQKVMTPSPTIILKSILAFRNSSAYTRL